MNKRIKNIFGLTNPQKYECTLWRYQSGHSLMAIKAFNPEKTLFLIFENVIYFDGPIYWAGADFDLETTDELKVILTMLEFNTILSTRFKLYTLERNSHKLKIVAENIITSDELPPNFSLA